MKRRPGDLRDAVARTWFASMGQEVVGWRRSNERSHSRCAHASIAHDNIFRVIIFVKNNKKKKATAIPAFATAPALVFVACLMARALRDIDWDDASEYVPAVVVAIGIPFTFSIAEGIGLGFVVYVVVKAAAGRFGAIAGAVWLIAGLSLLRFALGG